ncbi:amidohydrolase [Frankia sp. CcI49]|uniref:amidohydrolase family protein n=1 Tax=Frankia sp. CcI49 TaxID=1745382 RepID=UPI000977E9CC|nr:amidohydrolase family protein [Frankia sp. CcI49]ONH59119.1 amidohydrolase [Frankia sp. CcI49]
MAESTNSAAVEIPPIISVDDHVVEPRDLWQRWLPARWRDAGPKIVRGPYEMVPEGEISRAARSGWSAFRPAATGPETDWWLFEGDISATLLGNAAAGLPSEEVVPGPISYDRMRPGFYSVKERLEDMSINHIERSMCFPTYPRFAGQRFLDAKDKDLGLACVRAYNDWMVDEWCGDSGGRLIPLCIVPLWDAELAAMEVRRNAERGVRAVVFTELPSAQGLPSIHDANGYWDPFFTACNETGTVICIHIGSSGQGQMTSDDAPLCVPIALTTTASQFAMADWLLSGNLVRFPNLRIAFSESQIGWMPFLWERLDNLWHKKNYHDDWSPLITQPPSSYVPGHIWGCFFEDAFGIKARQDIGIDMITFECDYPHQDSSWPNTKTYAEKVLAGLNPTEIFKIVRGNAIEMLQLEPHLTDVQVKKH